VSGSLSVSTLELARRACGFTQKQLAGLAGMTYEQVGRLERGSARPYPATANALAASLGVSTRRLFPDGAVSVDCEDLVRVLYALYPSEAREA
jgi:transcriptional regulator with XRE-family HTH domain